MNADLNNDSFKKIVRHCHDYLFTESHRLMNEARGKRADGVRIKTTLNLLDKCKNRDDDDRYVAWRQRLGEYRPMLSEARRLRERGKAMRDAAYVLNNGVLPGKDGGAQ